MDLKSLLLELIKPPTMRTSKLTLARKLRILQIAEQTGNVRATSRKLRVQPSQIRRWRAQKAEISKQVEKKSQNKLLYIGKTPENYDLEQDVYKWILASRNSDICATTNDIICRAVSLQLDFKGGEMKKLLFWVYAFMRCNNITVRTATHVGQKTASNMMKVQQDYAKRTMMSYFNNVSDAKLFVNMDETNIHFNCKPKRTVHTKGSKTISIRIGCSTSLRVTLCVSIAMDGTKLPLFIIFKGKPNGHIDNALKDILPAGVFGCVQKKAWMEDRAMHIWYDKIWKPYVENCNMKSVLLLDDFKCHKQPALDARLKEINTN